MTSNMDLVNSRDKGLDGKMMKCNSKVNKIPLNILLDMNECVMIKRRNYEIYLESFAYDVYINLNVNTH